MREETVAIVGGGRVMSTQVYNRRQKSRSHNTGSALKGRKSIKTSADRIRSVKQAKNVGSQNSKNDKLTPDSVTIYFTNAVCCNCGRSTIVCGQEEIITVKRLSSNWKCHTCLPVKGGDSQKQSYPVAGAALPHRQGGGVQLENSARKQSYIESEYRPIILKAYGNQEPIRLVLNSLSLEKAVYLLSFISALTENVEDKRGLQLISLGHILAPTWSLGLEMLIRLHKSKLISVHPYSPIEAFSGPRAERIRYDEVYWFIAGFQSMNSMALLAEDLKLKIRQMEHSAEWMTSALDLWRKVSLAECLEFFALNLKLYGVEFFPGEMSREFIRKLLQVYPASIVCNFIWEAVRDTARYANKNRKIPKDRAYNTVVRSIEYYANRARNQKITILPRTRDSRCPQTMVSKVLFNIALGIGEDGFYYPPNRELLSG